MRFLRKIESDQESVRLSQLLTYNQMAVACSETFATIKTELISLLGHIERENDVTILYAAEAGIDKRHIADISC